MDSYFGVLNRLRHTFFQKTKIYLPFLYFSCESDCTVDGQVIEIHARFKKVERVEHH